jgi:hypothetical protein
MLDARQSLPGFEHLGTWNTSENSTEVNCEFLKSSFFVVGVFLLPNRVVIRKNMHRGATRTPHMAPWGWGKGQQKKIFP